MGMFIYPAVYQSEISMSLAVGLMAIVGFGFLAMSICTIAVFAFYFYPSKKRNYEGRERYIQVLRIIVMVALWLVIHNRFFDTAIGVFVVHMMPMAANNLAVFVTPFIFESLMIMACVAVGNIAVMIVHKLLGNTTIKKSI
jgi:cbb3-type cytochrome oxidase subunit 3